MTLVFGIADTFAWAMIYSLRREGRSLCPRIDRLGYVCMLKSPSRTMAEPPFISSPPTHLTVIAFKRIT
ncbi:hypothetical protein DTO021D3_3511 [Paecilomyces variotii]|nr:hypothetical protein DTO032I3_6622 [Paecilomyces variotii]KAJ9279720.1 hypothetical protein DTO021D3_3511 [Paecilomyces variotii]KAJ9347159.1 hypothetical protein DTO027B6_33 [Paecilomyces variotii]KAJ9384915.1 hypothetical protein DTO032I4_4308 [Paecilomyces variotii]